jgi:hypothetical protein
MRVRPATSLVWSLYFVTVVTAIIGLTLASVNHRSEINKFSVTGALLGATFPLSELSSPRVSRAIQSAGSSVPLGYRRGSTPSTPLTPPMLS